MQLSIQPAACLLQSACSHAQVVASTGLVVAPYNEYPQLLAILLRLLSEGSQPLRISVVKVSALHGPHVLLSCSLAELAHCCCGAWPSLSADWPGCAAAAAAPAWLLLATGIGPHSLTCCSPL